jgi:hypothetical protein
MFTLPSDVLHGQTSGLVVRTLADLYGEEAAQETESTEWIRLASKQGDGSCSAGDNRIRWRPAERDALDAEKIRAFCLTNVSRTAKAQLLSHRRERFQVVIIHAPITPDSCIVRPDARSAHRPRTCFNDPINGEQTAETDDN